MWLRELALDNFRNFRRLRFQPQPGVLLFSGRNGQGKTNLLESVYVLATTRSPRTSAERELLSWQTPEDADLAAVVPPFARLEARLKRRDAEVHLELAFQADRATTSEEASGSVSRAIKVNGLPTRATGLVGQLLVVYFSPADVALAGGSPAGRRQYLNLANSQVASSHLRALQRYNRVLLQRNQVLRQIRQRRQSPRALEPWTEQMLAWGAQIVRQRVCMLRDLGPRAAAIFRDLAGSDEALKVCYRSTIGDIPPDDGTPPEVGSLEASFRERQEQVSAREVDQAVSLVGPHRDDFQLLLDEVDLTTYGSRGQQRLAVLALKLAEADWMRALIGEAPVVLLDDVLSELDPPRRGYVLDRVAAIAPAEARQVWITTTDTVGFGEAFLGAAQRYVIDAGQLRRA